MVGRFNGGLVVFDIHIHIARRCHDMFQGLSVIGFNGGIVLMIILEKIESMNKTEIVVLIVVVGHPYVNRVHSAFDVSM